MLKPDGPTPSEAQALNRRWQLYAVGSEIAEVRSELAFALGFVKGRKRMPKWLVQSLERAAKHANLALAEYGASSQLANEDVRQERARLRSVR